MRISAATAASRGVSGCARALGYQKFHARGSAIPHRHGETFFEKIFRHRLTHQAESYESDRWLQGNLLKQFTLRRLPPDSITTQQS